MREDIVVLVFLVLFIIAHVPFFLPNFSSESLSIYSRALASVFLLPFVVVVLWPRQQKDHSENERMFWKSLSFAFALWWFVNTLYLFWSPGSWSALLDISTDAAFLGFYIGWFVALGFAPHNQEGQVLNSSDRWLLGAAVLVLALCLFFYFILIPSRVTPEIYASWVPSLLFFTCLDAVLVIWLVRLVLKAKTLYWKVMYSMLAITCFTYAGLDLLEAMNYAARYQWAKTAVSDILWSLPYLLIVVIARARYFEFPAAEIDINIDDAVKQRSIASISPIILVSFFLPVLHIFLDQLGLLHDEMRQAQASVVLGGLAIFCLLAMLENRSLRRVFHEGEARSVELEALRVKQQVAKRAAKMKDRFFANVSHEIRTPMNGILGMSEILLRGELNNEQQEHAKLVNLSAQGMVKVVDDILAYSKYEAGELALVQEPFRLDETATQVLDLFRASQEQKDIEMFLKFQDDMPLGLEGDSSRLRLVLMNLVANAIKFTQEGEIRIGFTLVETSDSTARIRCEVIDSGIGIKSDAVDELFLPFSQADESSSRKYGGSGLGLAISKKIVEAHSGKIGAFNNPEQGAVFWFEIPFELVANKADALLQEPDVPPSVVTSEQKSDRQILLAEDDVVNQLVAVKQLEILGYQVDVASNGKEVLKALGQHTYALILMDCQMPELDGLQATRLIREQGYSKSELPIVALTANVFDEDRESCFEAGMNDFIAKPVMLESLRDVVGKWL